MAVLINVMRLKDIETQTAYMKHNETKWVPPESGTNGSVLTYILQQNKRTTGGKGQESGKRSRSEKTAKQWKPFLYKPRP
jgi:hypothetical protein